MVLSAAQTAAETPEKKRRSAPLRAGYSNHVWTYDFLVDELTRELIGIAVDGRMPASRLSEGGPDSIARAAREWFSQRGTKAWYMDPGSPWKNAFRESFSDKLRAEWLDLEEFETLPEAKVHRC